MVKLAKSLLRNETIVYKEIKRLLPRTLESSIEIKLSHTNTL